MITENEFSPAPGGSGGSIGVGQSFGTFSSPSISQNSDHFVKGNKNTIQSSSSGSIESDVDKLFLKKETPTPDEVYSGLRYEFSQMTIKDLGQAKKLVISNLRRDPKYYSKLTQFNMTDDSLEKNIKNSTTETVKLLDDMIEAKRKSVPQINSKILDILREKQEEKSSRISEKMKSFLSR